ncbi:hypothetical protein J1N35_008306 [Gossypium stocksii]|uniref:Uncharacterized protein n=1 Tax=Gossypium stocksii TaxID=47602 RepID=A0A9D4AGC6_9ROSI|nr:hypothetical protein J1N35_008306 [Gossypium stocksii]
MVFLLSRLFYMKQDIPNLTLDHGEEEAWQIQLEEKESNNKYELLFDGHFPYEEYGSILSNEDNVIGRSLNYGFEKEVFFFSYSMMWISIRFSTIALEYLTIIF